MDQDTFHRLLGTTAATRLVQARTRGLSDQLGGPHSLEHVATVRGGWIY